MTSDEPSEKYAHQGYMKDEWIRKTYIKYKNTSNNI